MTGMEMEKIFNLLREYYPNARQLKSKTTLAAWRLVLEKFPYPGVKARIVRHAAGQRFFPDVYDITGSLEPEPDAFPPREAAPQPDPFLTPHTLRNARVCLAYGRKRTELERQARREGKPFDLPAVCAQAHEYASALRETAVMPRQPS